MEGRCGFIDGWLECDLEPGHDGLHEDHWLGGGTPALTTKEARK